MANKIRELFQESINVKQKVIESDAVEKLKHMAELTSNAIENGNKLLLCGNGGSAADAQHLAAEMLVRLRPSINREGVAAITLAQDTSTITACGNDFGYDELYKRTLQALGKKGDILIGITTSGNSENIIQAMQAAKDMDIIVFGFLGSGGGKALRKA